MNGYRTVLQGLPGRRHSNRLTLVARPELILRCTAGVDADPALLPDTKTGSDEMLSRLDDNRNGRITC